MSKKAPQNHISKSTQVLDSLSECPVETEAGRNAHKGAKDYSNTVKHSFFKSRFGQHSNHSHHQPQRQLTAITHDQHHQQQQQHAKGRSKKGKEHDLQKSASVAYRGGTVKTRKLRDALLTGSRSVEINHHHSGDSPRSVATVANHHLQPVKEANAPLSPNLSTHTMPLPNQQITSGKLLSVNLSTDATNNSSFTRNSDLGTPIDSQTTLNSSNFPNTLNNTPNNNNNNNNNLTSTSTQANPIEMAHFICYAITNHEDAHYLLFWLSSLPLPSLNRGKRTKWLKLLDKTFLRPHSNMFIRGIASNNVHVEAIQRYAHKSSVHDDLLVVSLRALQSSVVPYIKTIIDDFTSQKVLGLIDTTNSLENVKSIQKDNMQEIFEKMNEIFLLNLKLYRVNTQDKNVFFQSSTPTPNFGASNNNTTSNSMGEHNPPSKKRSSQRSGQMQMAHLLGNTRQNEKTIDEDKENFNFITTFSIINYMFYMGAGQNFIEEVIATSSCSRKRLQKCFELGKLHGPQTTIDSQAGDKLPRISRNSQSRLHSSHSHSHSNSNSHSSASNHFQSQPYKKTPIMARRNSFSPNSHIHTNNSNNNTYYLLAVQEYFESIQPKNSSGNSNTEPLPSSVRDEAFANTTSAITPTSYNRRRDNSTSLSTKGSVINLKDNNTSKDSYFGLNAVSSSVFFRSNRLMSQFSVDSQHRDSKSARKKYTNTMKNKKYEEVDLIELYALFDSIIDKPVVRFNEHLDLILNENNLSDTFRQAFPDTSSRLDDTQNKCYEFVYELYKTEVHYVRNLYILEKVYRFPLYELDIISKKVLNMLFINLDSLIGMHLTFLRELHKAVSAFDEKLQLPVAAIYNLLSLSEDLDVGFSRSYCYLCSLQEHSVYELKNYINKYSTLMHYFKHTESLQIMKRLKFIDIRASVYQRLCGYELLFKGILKNNENGSDSDNALLQKCIGKIQEVLQNVNGAIEEYRNYLTFRFLERQINWKSSDATSNEAFAELLSKYMMTPKRFLQQANFEWRLGKNKARDVCVVLTDKYLLLLHIFESEFMGPNDQQYSFIFPRTSVVMGKVTMKQELMPIVELSDIMAREVAADPLCFYVIVVSKSKMNQIYHIRAGSVEEQKQWTEAINRQAAREKQGLPSDCKLNITYLMNYINEHTDTEHQQVGGSEAKTEDIELDSEAYVKPAAAAAAADIEESKVEPARKKNASVVMLQKKRSLTVTGRNPRPVHTKARASSIHPRPNIESATDEFDDDDIKTGRLLPKQLVKQGEGKEPNNNERRLFRSFSMEVPFDFMTHKQFLLLTKKVEKFVADNKFNNNNEELLLCGKERPGRIAAQRFYTVNSEAGQGPLKKSS